MGENTEMTGKEHTPTERMQEEIRHTEAEIRKTVHTIEGRLSPANLKREALRKSKHYIFKGIAEAIGFVQRKPVQTALAGTGAILLLARGMKKPRSRERTATRMELAGTAAKAFVSGAAGRMSKDSSRSGKRIIWRGIATALGAAASTLWYRRKETPRPAASVGHEYEIPRAGAYPGLSSNVLEHSRP